MRIWLAYKLTGKLFLSSGKSNYYAGTAEMTKLLNASGYVHRGFVNSECRSRICITRDPVDRFVSCFLDKIIKEGRMTMPISEFLKSFHETIKKDQAIVEPYGISKLDFHFRPQVYHFGASKQYYTRIFTVSQISTSLKSFLEDHWNIKLPDIHARNSSYAKAATLLSEKDKELIKNLYEPDYKVGWGL